MTQKQPKKDRIEQIIYAAVAEFLDKGYEGTSVDSIAKRAGLTKGGVYHHFPNKDEILRAANDSFQKPINQLASRCMAIPSPLEGLHKFIHEFIVHWASHSREISFVFLSLSKMLAIPELWPMMQSYYEQGISGYQNLLERAVAKKELKPHNTYNKALALMSALDGITSFLVIMGESLNTEVLANQLEDALISDLRVETSSDIAESED